MNAQAVHCVVSGASYLNQLSLYNRRLSPRPPAAHATSHIMIIAFEVLLPVVFLNLNLKLSQCMDRARDSDNFKSTHKICQVGRPGLDDARLTTWTPDYAAGGSESEDTHWRPQPGAPSSSQAA